MSEIIQTVAQVEIQATAADGAKRKPRISILANSGGVQSAPGWQAHIIDFSGADLAGAIPILADHLDTLDGVAGQGRATVRDRRLYVDGTLTDATDAGKKILALAREGIALQASVGYEPTKREFVRPGDKATVNGRAFTAGDGGLTIIRTGRLREVSILPLGADPNTEVTIAAKAASQKGTRNMNNETIVTTEPTDAAKTETERIAMIRAATDGILGSSSDALRERVEFLRAEAVAGNETAQQFKAKLLGLIRSSRPTGPAIHCGAAVPAGAALEAATLIHMGHESLGERTLGAQAMEQGRALRATSLVDILRLGLRLDGREEPASRDGLIRLAFSTTSLPGILGNVANKLLIDSYLAFPSAARMIAKKLTANDFKQHTGYRLTGDAVMKEVNEAGEITHGSLGEAAYPFSVQTYGRMFGLTRQQVVNDDPGAFDQIPRMLGRGAAVALEELFWTLVLANTGSFFNATTVADGGHANLMSGADSALSLTSLGGAVATMMRAVDEDNHPININPRFLCVPPELKALADSLYRSTTVIATGGGETAERIPAGNTFFGMYEPVASPYISNESYSGYSTTQWYLFGDPADVAAFGIAYLNGQESPVIEQVEMPPEILGIAYRGYADFGVCQIDHRGAVKSAGA